ncbi:MAG: MSHA pilin protein MshC [Paraglaciecola psychrophila]|jgi:MSHA pilin protein MshC
MIKVANSSGGFSLIELVTVIIVLGILAVVLLPKFSARQGFVEYALRDQLISAFRQAQQRAMYDHGGSCYSLTIDSAGFGPRRDGIFIAEPVGEVTFTADYEGLSVAPTETIYFDGLGNTYTTDCGTDPLVAAHILTIAPGGITVSLFPTGFIKAL